jgi:hypothetical protein
VTLKPSAPTSTLAWAKSSYSGSDNNDCVEVAWVKSSYSSNDGPECVEVKAGNDTVLVRDSKDPDGPHLSLTPTEWSAFVAHAASYEV